MLVPERENMIISMSRSTSLSMSIREHKIKYELTEV